MQWFLFVAQRDFTWIQMYDLQVASIRIIIQSAEMLENTYEMLEFKTNEFQIMSNRIWVTYVQLQDHFLFFEFKFIISR